jgi:hypothetical protein
MAVPIKLANSTCRGVLIAFDFPSSAFRIAASWILAFMCGGIKV